MKIIVEIQDGDYAVSGGACIEPIILNWDSDSESDWDFDSTEQNIRELLDSDLDGPQIFALIKRCIERFEHLSGPWNEVR